MTDIELTRLKAKAELGEMIEILTKLKNKSGIESPYAFMIALIEHVDDVIKASPYLSTRHLTELIVTLAEGVLEKEEEGDANIVERVFNFIKKLEE